MDAEWYWLIRAARFLRVSPWALARRPTIWRDLALIAESMEPPQERLN